MKEGVRGIPGYSKAAIVEEKIKILFVCTANKMRSKTAEVLYKEDSRFMVKSAGIAAFAEVPLNLELLTWADYIVVMEKMHREWIRTEYPRLFTQKQDIILSLDIPDRYDYMDPQLVILVRQTFEPIYEKVIKGKRTAPAS